MPKGIKGFQKGHIVSEETKRKISLANKGKIRSDEVKEKLSILNKGKKLGPRTEETKMKISESNKIALKKYYDNGGTPWNKGKKGTFKHTEEYKNKLRLRQQKMYKIGLLPQLTPMPKGMYKKSIEERKKISLFMATRIHTEESREKRRIKMSGEKNPNWKGGVSDYHRNKRGIRKWNKIRKEVYIRDKFTCQHCHRKGIELDCHHIIPYRDNGSDNKENLIALCRSCHAKAEQRNNRLWIKKQRLLFQLI